jgi:hypothetical protein
MVSIASPTFSGVSPPARMIGFVISASIEARPSQLNVSPCPPCAEPSTSSASTASTASHVRTAAPENSKPRITGTPSDSTNAGDSSPCTCAQSTFACSRARMAFGFDRFATSPTLVTKGGRMEAISPARAGVTYRGEPSTMTSPMASAPAVIASAAVSMSRMPQILMRVRLVAASVIRSAP